MRKQIFLQDLINRMSMEEKLGQLNLLTGAMDSTGMKNSGDLMPKIRNGTCGAVFNVFTPSATRTLQDVALESPMGIPLIFGYDVIHGHRTIYPIPLGLSCSWNLDLVRRCAQMAGAEAAADGLHWVYSPMVDISQDARWGRVAEGSGEDPWLGSKIAAAMVTGYQGASLAEDGSVVACVKHFALYGAPMGGRDYNTVDMSRSEMEETYFPPYRAAVEAGARTVMTSFNEIDGIPASANRWLLTEKLRKDWGFNGCVVTDYTAVTEMKSHGTSANDADAAKQSLDAGVDMDMVSEAFITELPQLLATGDVSETQINTAVMRVLELKWDLGLFENPYSHCNEEHARTRHLCKENRELSRLAALESVVLLKNESQLLPLTKQGSIAVIGPLADSRRDMLGCWVAAGDEMKACSAFEGICEAVGDRAVIHFAKGCDIQKENDSWLADAKLAASCADIVVLVLGESWQMSGEAASRTNIKLPKCQRKLAAEMLKMGKPCVLITMSGRPLELSWEDKKFSSILHAWALGTEGGRALADIIFGTAAPIGKLTMGFPRHVGQLPMTYREKSTGRPYHASMQYSSKYLDAPNDALYPFGHGLTYGKFRYGKTVVSSSMMKLDETLTISSEITNLTQHPATETLQLYLRDLVASVSRPIKELRGYERVNLAPGETRLVSFIITSKDLSFIGRDLKPVIELGEFDAMIGPNSKELQAARFTLY